MPVPDAEAWKAMSLQSGDQVAELPRVRSVCSVPSVFIKNRSEELIFPVNGSDRRVLSKMIFFPSGDKLAKPSKDVLLVKRRGFVASGFIR